MIGSKLKELRVQNKYTVARLCELTGLNQNTYAKYERNERDVSTETLSMLAKFYGVSTDYLLGIPGAKPPETALERLEREKHFKELEKTLIEEYLTLTEKQREMFLDYMYRVIDKEAKRKGMVKSPDGVTYMYPEKPPPKPVKLKPPDPEEEEEDEALVSIRCSMYKASAGTGYDLSDSDQWREIQIPDTREARRADFCVEVDGDSMNPHYYNGDLVLVKHQPEVDIGEVGIFVVNGSGYIKKRGKDRLISLNDDYEDVPLDETQVQGCAGKVIGRIPAEEWKPINPAY